MFHWQGSRTTVRPRRMRAFPWRARRLGQAPRSRRSLLPVMRHRQADSGMRRGAANQGPEPPADSERSGFRALSKASAGRMVANRSWVAAILWSTDERDRAPVSILWDPPSDGEPLGPEEVHQHANAIRNHRNDIIASRLGNPDFVVRVAIKPSEGGTHPPAEQSIDHSRSHLFDRVSKEQHVSDYQAAVISALGIQPIRNDADLQETQALRQRTKNNGESVMIFGISDTRSEAGRSQERPWVSYNGIASTDGLSLFSLADAELKAS